jgi:hypothetical protein
MASATTGASGARGRAFESRRAHSLIPLPRLHFGVSGALLIRWPLPFSDDLCVRP